MPAYLTYPWLALITAGAIYTLLSTLILLREKYVAKKSSARIDDYPPVTILKPLKGMDGTLEENLRSVFALVYPDFEVIFGVNDLDDAAIEVVKKLQLEYPRIKTRMILDTRQVGLNPKVNNLANMYRFATHDILVISDSNVRVSPDYLQRLMNEFQSGGGGLLTSTIRGTGGRGLGAALENLHLNCYVAPNIFAVRTLFSIAITIGKSMCFRRTLVDEIGGFEKLANYLAEDHVIGQSARAFGLPVRTTFYPIDCINQGWNVTDFFNRHLRWAVMRRKVSLFHYAAEIGANPVAVSFAYLLGQRSTCSLLLFLGMCAYTGLVNLWASRLLACRQPVHQFLLVPLKELLMAAIWCRQLFTSRISWRGHHFRVGPDTTLEPLEDKPTSFRSSSR